MRKATRADKDRVVEILAAAYDTNPSINWIIRNDHKRLQRIKALASYSFEAGMDKDAVFISSDENGVAFFFPQTYNPHPIKDFLRQLTLAVTSLNIPAVLKREGYCKKMKPASGEFINFWFFGVFPGKSGGNAGIELKDYVFKVSREKNLPIYVETTVLKNKRVYERYGFKTYHKWEVPEKNITFHFLKRDPQ